MSKYYIEGYQVPDDVHSAEDVKRYQELLGVSVDGIWGKNTQRAYEKYIGRKDKSQNSSSDGFDWESISERIRDNLAEILRPAVDNAIKNRKEAAELNKAEIDADAAARGMESSTYVTAVKSLENESLDDDIMSYEANYNSTLSSNLQSALMSAYEVYSDNQNAQKDRELQAQRLKQEQEQFEAQMKHEREQLNEQMKYEREKLRAQYPDTADKVNGGLGYGYEDYDIFMRTLDGKEINKIFKSTSEYWTWLRNQIIADIGDIGYYALYRDFLGTDDDSMSRYYPENHYTE